MLTASSRESGELSRWDKVTFSKRVIERQLFGECDFLFFDHLGLARVQSLIPSCLRRPYGVFLHSVEAWAPLSPTRLKALVQADIRVANSHYTAERVSAAHPEVGKIDVCHLTLGLNMLHGGLRNVPATLSQRELLCRVQARSVLVVGRMMKSERHKGHEQLIHAWPLVRKEVPDAQLVVVGQGDDVARLKGLARQVGIEESTLFMGHVDDHTLREIYQRVAVFAMPSRGEGFGIVYLEAMFHRLACIGSIHDAAREIIVDGETGFLVAQDQISDLANKLTQLLSDQDLRDRFGSNGFLRLKTTLSYERFQSSIEESLEKLSADIQMTEQA